MTTIRFNRSGGIVGQEIDLTLDLDTLPASDALNVIRLVEKSDFFKLPEDLVGTARPDQFIYTLMVESGSSKHNIRTSDTGAPDSLRPLLNVLSTLALVK